MFDFHRHINKCNLLNNAFYATSNQEEWNRENSFISLGLLLVPNKKYDLDKILLYLEKRLSANKNFQIGEIGIDKRFGEIENQIYFLDKCLKLATKYNRVLTIHCVQSYNLLIRLLKNHANSMPPLIILHGFSSSLEIARELKKLNVIISINPNFFNTRGFKNIKEFDKLGFLTETDWDKDNDDGYQDYFLSFINSLKEIGLTNFEDINNEYRTILENITFSR